MKAVAVLLCTVGVVFAASLPSMGSSDSVGPALLDIAHTVNGKAGVSWKAGHNERWNRYSEKEVRAMLGVKFDDSVVIADRARFSAAQYARTPKELDLRTRTVGNTTCIGPILDQAKCGSCWAFAAAEAISDRFCLKTGSFVQLAPLDLVACDQNDGGCEGGDPGSAWQYATGGLALETCLPYLQSEGGPIPTCPPAQEPCLDFVSTPNCPATCNGGAAIDRSHQVATVYGLNSVQDMMTELNENGSIEVAFTVYSDFLTYKSGVYTYQTGDALGGHAVKMIGYGTENGVDYWLCQNSWTTTWGDAGFFKIRRGTDECGIEDDAVAGTLA